MWPHAHTPINDWPSVWYRQWLSKCCTPRNPEQTWIFSNRSSDSCVNQWTTDASGQMIKSSRFLGVRTLGLLLLQVMLSCPLFVKGSASSSFQKHVLHFLLEVVCAPGTIQSLFTIQSSFLFPRPLFPFLFFLSRALLSSGFCWCWGLSLGHLGFKSSAQTLCYLPSPLFPFWMLKCDCSDCPFVKRGHLLCGLQLCCSWALASHQHELEMYQTSAHHSSFCSFS